MLKSSDNTSVETVQPLEGLYQLTLALGLGLFVGLEREWSGKAAGLRTFGFTAVIGATSAILGESYSIACLLLTGLLIGFINFHSLKVKQQTELTTSAALIIVCLAGILCGRGKNILPASLVFSMAGLLTYKQQLVQFSQNLTVAELRAASLLAILSFAIYPALPAESIDPWGWIHPKEVWGTVILISSIGFVNYLLWKVYGQKGLELTGFLGGLVNSTVSVTELSIRSQQMGTAIQETTFRGVLLGTVAMTLRNNVLLALLAPGAAFYSLIPLSFLLLACGYSVRRSLIQARKKLANPAAPTLPLSSPFSLFSAVKFAALFLGLHIVGLAAQETFGYAGFYFVSSVGGLISSASSVASAGSLAKSGILAAPVAGGGAVLASLASAGVNLMIVHRYADNLALFKQLSRPMGVGIFLALCAAIIQASW